VDLLEHEAALRYTKDPGLFRREAEHQIRAGVRTIFVDEVQKIPALLDEIHSLIEEHGVRFILSGSSARRLKRGGANLLAGRAIVRRLHPLTVLELGDRFDLDRALRYGTLPAAVTGDEDDARDLLRTYSEVYLREEVQLESLVRNLGGFARFLDVAAGQSGEIINFSAIGRDAMLATRTVQEYFQILEDTLLGFRLEAWRRSPRGRMVAHPRFYLFDPGVTNALNRRLSAPLDSAAFSRLFEQWVILECLRQIDYSGSEARLFYWRTHVGAEVDLLVEKHGKLRVAVEIKSKKTISGADLTGLRTFKEAHGAVPRVVACQAPRPYELEQVEVTPYLDFLRGFHRWL